jgi:GTPase
LILAVNKWDAVSLEHRNPKSYGERVFRKLVFVDFAPLVFLSALTGEGIPDLARAIEVVAGSYQRRIQTSPLNQALHEIVRAHTPPLHHGRAVKFFYATQTATRPPTFTIFVGRPEGIPSGYQRYLVHHLRSALGLAGTPIRLKWRARRENRKRKS